MSLVRNTRQREIATSLSPTMPGLVARLVLGTQHSLAWPEKKASRTVDALMRACTTLHDITITALHHSTTPSVAMWPRSHAVAAPCSRLAPGRAPRDGPYGLAAGSIRICRTLDESPDEEQLQRDRANAENREILKHLTVKELIIKFCSNLDLPHAGWQTW